MPGETEENHRKTCQNKQPSSKWLNLYFQKYNGVLGTSSCNLVVQQFVFQQRTIRHEQWIGEDLEWGDCRPRLAVLRPAICYPESEGASRFLWNAANLLWDYTRCHNPADHNLNASGLFEDTIPVFTWVDGKPKASVISGFCHDVD
jgi:hypothetical protein